MCMREISCTNNSMGIREEWMGAVTIQFEGQALLELSKKF